MIEMFENQTLSDAAYMLQMIADAEVQNSKNPNPERTEVIRKANELALEFAVNVERTLLGLERAT